MNKIPAALFILLLMATAGAFGQQTTPDAPVPAGRGTLIVLSDPVGADILLNNKPMGTTPLRIINIPAAIYRLTIKGSERKPLDSTITVAANATQKISLVLLPILPGEPGEVQSSALCTLVVKTTPPGATLFVNDRPAGVTPFANDTMQPGTYHLRLDLAGYNSMEGTLDLLAGESHTVDKKMAFKPVAVATAAAPASAAQQKPAAVPAKDSAASLARAKAAITQEPKLKGPSHGGRTARRWIFGTLAAAAGSTGWYFDTRVAAAVDEQKKIQAEYRTAGSGFDQYETRFNSAGKKARDHALVRNILYGSAAGCGLLFLISIPF